MSFVDQWDTGQAGATWDSGLQWDVNVGPATGNVNPYLQLITSKHYGKPKFMNTVAITLQPFADLMFQLNSLSAKFDLDVAAGDQLDAIGEWVGVQREISTPLVGVYFSLDSGTLGLDQGTMQGPFDPTTALVSLPDDSFRTLIRARIASNQWDGTVPGAYAAWDTLFAGTGFGILIQNLGGMHMIYALTGPAPDAVTQALFTGGYLNIKPASVQIDFYMTPAATGIPYFGLDSASPVIAGLDIGAFGNTFAGT